MGATVERVRPVSITHRDHYVNIARRRALEANELASKNRKPNQYEDTDVKPIDSYISDGGKEGIIFSSDCRGGFFADQFENLANFRAHYEGTGPEIWEQSTGQLDAFVAAAGTGGTVAGVSRFLKVRFSSPSQFSIPIFPHPHFFFVCFCCNMNFLPLLYRKKTQISNVFSLTRLVQVCLTK